MGSAPLVRAPASGAGQPDGFHFCYDILSSRSASTYSSTVTTNASTNHGLPAAYA